MKGPYTCDHNVRRRLRETFVGDSEWLPDAECFAAPWTWEEDCPLWLDPVCPECGEPAVLLDVVRSFSYETGEEVEAS